MIDIRTRLGGAWVLPGIGIMTVTGLTVVPTWGSYVCVLVALAATVAPLAGIAIGRPGSVQVRCLTSLMLGIWTVSTVNGIVNGRATETTARLIDLGLLVALVIVGLLFRAGRSPASRPRRNGSRPGAEYVEAVLVLVIFGLVVAQIATAVLRSHDLPSAQLAAAPAADVLFAALFVRLLLSRSNLPGGALLAAAAALSAVCFDLVATATGHRALDPGDPRLALWTLSAGLYVWASLIPSEIDPFDIRIFRSRRPESARLLGLVPLVGVPIGLYAVGREAQSRLPLELYIAAAATVAALGLIRATIAVGTVERLAELDPLTDLANRRGLARAFESMILPTAAPGSVLCLLDVDDFKQINDTFGHEVGDDVLRQLAHRLRFALAGAASGGVVARPGGDEFVLLLSGPAPDPDGVLAAALREPFDVMGHRRTLRISAGLAPLSPDSTLSGCLVDADLAMYTAKADGKGSVVRFAPGQRERILGQLRLADELQSVLAGRSDAGRLELHYQPLAELESGRVAGFEALVRWNHPEEGLLAPGRFVDLAEKHGLGRQLDRWTLHAALRQVADWNRLGPRRPYVSVNLGHSALADPDLAEEVLAALARTEVPAGQLHLEILEHEQLDAEAGEAALRILAEAGVVVSLDDFGTGYTSLDYLRRYPVTQVKLDRSLITDLDTPITSALLEGIVVLAGNLGLELLAEGIETQDQWDRLLTLGIPLGQGYLLARPQPAHAVLPFVTEGTLDVARTVPAPRSGNSSSTIQRWGSVPAT